MTNRNPLKQFFITFPDSKDMTRKQFLGLFPECKFAMVSQETHQDGRPHIHMSCQLVEKMTKTAMIKHIRTQLPDDWKRIQIAPTRSLKHSVDYISKEDETPLIHGFIPKRKASRKSIRRALMNDPTLFKAIMEEWSYDNLYI